MTPLSHAEAAWLRRHYNAGHSVTALATALHMGRDRVNAAIDAMGLPRRHYQGGLPPPKPFDGSERSKPKQATRNPAARPLAWNEPRPDGDLRCWDREIVPGWKVHDFNRAPYQPCGSRPAPDRRS